jgi:hypothetical protein
VTDPVEPSQQPVPDRTAAEGAAYRWALRTSAISLAVLAVAGVATAAAVRGADGAWGALVGVALAAVAGLVTQVAMVYGYRREPLVFASIVGGSWLAKMAVILVGMLALSGVSGIDKASFAIAALIGIVVTLGIDVMAVRAARIPYANTGSNSAES